jgi:O-antigen/teichoic acid export membrane protein
MWMFSEQIVRLLALFIVNIFIARYLGPASFGILSFSIGIVAVLLTVARLGMESILVRELIIHQDKTGIYMSTAFCSILITGLLLIAVIIVALNITDVDENTKYCTLLISLSLIPQAFLVLDYQFQSQTRAKYSALAKSIALIFSAIIKLYLVKTEAGLYAFATAILLESFLIAVFLYWVHRIKQTTHLKLDFDFQIAKSLYKSSTPMLLASLTTVLYMRIDQFIIKIILGDYETGVYSAISRLYEVWVMVTVVLCTSLLPAIVKLKEKSAVEYDTKLILLFRVVLILCVVVSAMTTVFSKKIILLLFGEPYIDGTTSFTILMWSAPFAALGSVTIRYLTVEKLENKVAIRAVVALVVNLVLNLLLIPNLGINGAAISTLLSLFVANYLIDYFDRDLKHLLYLKNGIFFRKTKNDI